MEMRSVETLKILREGKCHGMETMPSLAGRSAWIIADDRAGHVAITKGIADALHLNAEVKHVAPRRLFRMIAPWGPADLRVIKELLAEPWPAIAIGAGRQTVPIIRALKRRTRSLIFTVLCQDPKATLESADLIWVPEHDRLRERTSSPRSPRRIAMVRNVLLHFAGTSSPILQDFQRRVSPCSWAVRAADIAGHPTRSSGWRNACACSPARV